LKGTTILKRIIFILTIALFFVCESLVGQSATPDSAQMILKTALQEAKTSGKNVVLIFHATWCSWCRRLEAAMETPSIKEIIEKHYVVMKLDVLERGDKIKSHENPGGREILKKLGGENSGLPFLAFLTADGTMIANSNVMPDNQNIGYPGSKEEISAFMKLLQRTSHRMNAKQRAIISGYLIKNAPKQ
jgi:thioredoxin-related protein